MFKISTPKAICLRHVEVSLHNISTRKALKPQSIDYSQRSSRFKAFLVLLALFQSLRLRDRFYYIK